MACKVAWKDSPWEPIETAPKEDGKLILAYEPGLDMRLVFRRDGIWLSYDEHDFAPTHWMPLPNPPESR